MSLSPFSVSETLKLKKCLNIFISKFPVFNVSETRFIRSIKVNFEGSEIILCDTPGTKDSRGAVIDASNQYGLMLAAKSCTSMVPLVLISRNSVGERCITIKETLLGIAKIFKDVASIAKIRFLFTKFEESEKS